MTWRPALTATTGSQPAVLIVDDQTSVQLQLVEGSGYTWPTEVHDLEQRYAVGSDEQDWRSALGHQTRLSIRADQALDVVRTAWLTAAEGHAPA